MPNHPMVNLLDIMNRLGEGRLDGFETLAAATEKEAAHDPLALGFAAMAWVASDHAEQALSAAERSLKLDPSLDITHAIRSLAFLQLGKSEEADEALSTAVQTNPAAAHPYVLLAEMEHHRGNRKKAEEYCTRAMRATRQNALLYLVRGAIRFEEGNQVDALLDFGQAQKLDPRVERIIRSYQNAGSR
jgi:tetratricopeptide (TPR) repeat protein